MKIPIEPNSPEDLLARTIAKELVINGFNDILAFPVAIGIMCAVDKGHDDPLLGVKDLVERRQKTDEWWLKHHPHTKAAKEAQHRLKNVVCEIPNEGEKE